MDDDDFFLFLNPSSTRCSYIQGYSKPWLNQTTVDLHKNRHLISLYYKWCEMEMSLLSGWWHFHFELLDVKGKIYMFALDIMPNIYICIAVHRIGYAIRPGKRSHAWHSILDLDKCKWLWHANFSVIILFQYSSWLFCDKKPGIFVLFSLNLALNSHLYF